MSRVSRQQAGKGEKSRVQAFRPQGAFLGDGMVYAPRADSLVGLLAFSNVVFNLTDLATTLAAVGRGLAGVGPLVGSMSSALGMSPILALATTTGILVAGALAIAIVGVRSASRATRHLALCYLLVSTMAFYLISLNNIVWLVS
jgi:hypothetical protein